MDDKPGRLNQFRHQTKRRQSFASILPTDRSWPVSAGSQRQIRVDLGQS